MKQESTVCICTVPSLCTVLPLIINQTYHKIDSYAMHKKGGLFMSTYFRNKSRDFNRMASGSASNEKCERGHEQFFQFVSSKKRLIMNLSASAKPQMH